MIVEKIIKKLKQKNIDKFEILQKIIKKQSIEVFKGKVENFNNSEEIQLTIRILKNHKIGFTYLCGKDFDEKNLSAIIDNLTEFTNFSDKDEYYCLNEDSENIAEESINEKINGLTIDEMIKIACKIEDSAYSFDKRVKTVKNAGISKGEIEVKFINSKLCEKSYKTNFVGASVVSVAQSNGESYMGYESVFSRVFDIDPEKIGNTASNKAVRLFGSKKGNSMKCPVVFENELVADLMGLISPSFFVENIEKNKSLFFQNSYGDLIANPIITLIDDGTVENYAGTTPFDDEGVKTSKKYLIKQGKLDSFLNNLYYARKFKQNTTGNGFKPSFKSLPSISITNLILEKGEKSPEEEIKNIKKGLYVVNLMGLHTANPISGDFSLGAEAILIENGELTHPVKEIVISGNLKEILKNTKEIFNDVKCSGVIYSPSILVDPINVSG